MGTIGSLGGYYQLSNLLSSGSGSSASTSATSLDSLVQSLLSSGSGASNNTNAYLLDLSPEAQQILGTGATGTTSADGSSTRFVLTQAQQTAIENILEKFKGDPLTQDTFDQIQSALAAAGLSPQQLGAQDQIASFNPTNVLLEALSGNYTSIETPGASASTEQTKETNYLQSIVSLWKSENSTTSSGSGSSASGAASSGSGASL
jgi:hypothetical protein